MAQIGRGTKKQNVTLPEQSQYHLVLSWEALTDTGYVRAANEDSFLAKVPVFSVADGMGGHSWGDVASAAAVTSLAEYLTADFVAQEDITKALNTAVKNIKNCVDDVSAGTGTTVSGAALTLSDQQPHWLIFNVGDSRVYSYMDETLTALTIDHSVVQELMNSGSITLEEAKNHPHGNIITRAVGVGQAPLIDFFLYPVFNNSRLLVCSDGLTKEISDEEIRIILGEEPTAATAARRLVDAALLSGGRDNVTVIVVDVNISDLQEEQEDFSLESDFDQGAFA